MNPPLRFVVVISSIDSITIYDFRNPIAPKHIQTMSSSKNSNERKRKRDPDRDKREATKLPSPSSASFLTPQCPGFDQHVQDHYHGFVHCSVDDLQPFDFHERSRATLERLRDSNYYQYDIVMAGGKHSSRTFVKRTLVGNPGITYKYLGLRLFAHAWSGQGATPLMKAIGEMNQNMIKMTEEFPNHKKCQYNLTLINYMEPTARTRIGFKEEANYGMGKVSVSWHADSSLQTGSSIGVYHCLPTQKSSKWDWRIALRPSPESGNSAKPIVVDTKDGDAYFLLGDFNESHQHCVLAGSQSNRISSTHRVAVTEEDTYDYILKRVKIARKRFRLQMESKDKLDAKIIRYCQRVLTEVETEWIAQYWLQGAQHDVMHTWWQRPMKTLEAYWRALEVATWKLYHHLLSHNKNNNNTDVIKVLVNEFKNRQSLREQWDERRADKIYQRRIVEEYRPVARPLFDAKDNADEDSLTKDLTSSIKALQLLLGKGGSAKPKALEKNTTKPSKPNTATISGASPNDVEKTKMVPNVSKGSAKSDRSVGENASNLKKKRKKSKKKRK